MPKILMTASVWSHIRNFHLPYLRELQHRGWETHTACRGIPADPPFTDRGIELPLVKRMCSPENLRAALQLRKLIRQERYDLIVTHTSLAAFFTRLGVKGLRSRPRLVNVMHGYLFDDGTGAAKRSLLLGAERFTAPETDLLLTMNRWDTELARRLSLGKTVRCIPGMGVDYARLEGGTEEDGLRLRRELGFTEADFVLLYPAEFSPRKSQRVLIRAMAALPARTKLVLCGRGEEREACIALAKSLDLEDRVRFPGQVEDMPAWYRMADAAVTASRSEGLPFNVMEAMHLALPVVASDVKGNNDLIRDGETGLLYPYGDEAACAAAVSRLMASPDLRRQLGERAAAEAERYALDRVLPEVLAAMLGE